MVSAWGVLGGDGVMVPRGLTGKTAIKHLYFPTQEILIKSSQRLNSVRMIEPTVHHVTSALASKQNECQQ